MPDSDSSQPMPLEGRRIQICAFWIGDHYCGITLDAVAEVAQALTVRAIPLAPNKVEGLGVTEGEHHQCYQRTGLHGRRRTSRHKVHSRTSSHNGQGKPLLSVSIESRTLLRFLPSNFPLHRVPCLQNSKH